MYDPSQPPPSPPPIAITITITRLVVGRALCSRAHIIGVSRGLVRAVRAVRAMHSSTDTAEDVSPIPNFRDLGGRYGTVSLRTGCVYRSSAPHGASHMEFLRQKGVATLIDLRSVDEVRANPLEIPEKVSVCRANLLSGRTRFRGLFLPAPISLKLKVLGNKLILRDRAATSHMVTTLAGDPLYLLNRIMIDHADKELQKGLLTCFNPANFPVLLFCSLGKDRTGLMSALFLGACGVDHDSIVEEYAHSDLSALRDESIRFMRSQGMSDPEPFLACDPDVMHRVLTYIKERWGSMGEFLVSVGVTREDQERLRRAVCMPHGECSSTL